MRYRKQDFVLGQGLRCTACDCDSQYSALMFQPRVVAGLVAAGIAFHAPAIVAGLGVALAWCALIPTLNPFDALYNKLFKRCLGASPAPRRFAQGAAAFLLIATATAMHLGLAHVALALQVLFLTALVAVLAFRFCVGSAVFNSLLGARAQRTSC